MKKELLKILDSLIELKEISTNYSSFITKFVNTSKQKNGEGQYYLHGSLKLCTSICVTKDTLILTNKGNKPLYQVEIGDLVVTHKSRLKPVIDKFSNGIRDTLIIETKGGLKIEVSKEHPFVVDDYWVKAKDLALGDNVLTLYSKPEEWRAVNGFPYEVSSWGRVNRATIR